MTKRATMQSRRNTTAILAAMTLLFLCMTLFRPSASAQKQPPAPAPMARLTVQVTAGDENKPLADASIYLKFVLQREAPQRREGRTEPQNQSGRPRTLSGNSSGESTHSNRGARMENLWPILRRANRGADGSNSPRPPRHEVVLKRVAISSFSFSVCAAARSGQKYSRAARNLHCVCANSTTHSQCAQLRRSRPPFPHAFQHFC